MRARLAILLVLLWALLLPGCIGERHVLVEGPASLKIGATRWTPAIDAQLEEGARFYSSPAPPTDRLDGQAAPAPPIVLHDGR